jgi:hypothetical protein
MVSTGHSAKRTTFSATEPNISLRHPVGPWVAMTMRSNFSLAARATISPATSPSITRAEFVVSEGTFSLKMSSRDVFAASTDAWSTRDLVD